jgi:hypothetical protein
MKAIKKSASAIAISSKGNPVVAVLTVFLFYVAFNAMEASVETLIFGERFLHWLDPVFQLIGMAYAGCVVWYCAAYQVDQ